MMQMKVDTKNGWEWWELNPFQIPLAFLDGKQDSQAIHDNYLELSLHSFDRPMADYVMDWIAVIQTALQKALVAIANLHHHLER